MNDNPESLLEQIEHLGYTQVSQTYRKGGWDCHLIVSYGEEHFYSGSGLFIHEAINAAAEKALAAQKERHEYEATFYQ